MTWSLTWWPWALGHHVDPLQTHLLWAPRGFPTIWITAIPAVSLFGSPLTLTLGPVVAYNVLMFIAVGLAAACAYLLCYELSGSVGASLVGGLAFGLSPYMLGHTASQHLDLTFIWPIPLIAWAIVRRARRRWRSARSFVLVIAALLIVELGSSLELFLDLTLVLGLAFAIALLGARDRRRDVLHLGSLVGLAYCAALPLIAGAAYLALTTQHGAVPYPPADYSIDLANVVVPTPLSLLGLAGPARELSRHFVGNIGEQDGYLGLPALALIALAARARWRQGAWLAVSLLVVVFAVSLGPMLTVGGRPLVRLPFAASGLPLLADILPARLSLFTALLAACLVAVWLGAERRGWLRVGAGLLVLAFLLPNLVLSGHVANAWSNSRTVGFSTERPRAGFVASAGWRRLIRPDEIVLVLPTGARTPSLYWQVRGGMRFRLAMPNTPFVPPQIAAEPTVVGLVDQTLSETDGVRLAAARLRAFLANNHVGAVVTERGSKRWGQVVEDATATTPRPLAGYLVYPMHHLPPLRAVGKLVRHRAGAKKLRAWLSYDGRRARVKVTLGATKPVALSSPIADAEHLAATIRRNGRAAVAFTEWQGGVLRLRIAVHVPDRGWQLATLDRRTQPIWSPRVRISRNGTIIATWIDVANPLRLVRAAVRAPQGSWQPAQTLETGDGLGSVDIATDGAGDAVLAWHDILAGEQRIRLAMYTPAGWRGPTNVATTLTRIRHLQISRPRTLCLSWQTADNRRTWCGRDVHT